MPNALKASGRFSVIVAIWLARSRVSCWYAIRSLPSGPPAAALGRAREGGQDVLDPERLDEHGFEAVTDPLVVRQLDAEAGHHEDRHVGPVRLDVARDFPAGQAGHREIREHDVEARALSPGDRFGRPL